MNIIPPDEDPREFSKNGCRCDWFFLECGFSDPNAWAYNYLRFTHQPTDAASIQEVIRLVLANATQKLL